MLRYATVSASNCQCSQITKCIKRRRPRKYTAATDNHVGDWTSSLMATDDTQELINVTCVLQSCGLPDPAFVVTLIARCNLVAVIVVDEGM